MVALFYVCHTIFAEIVLSVFHDCLLEETQ